MKNILKVVGGIGNLVLFGEINEEIQKLRKEGQNKIYKN